MSPELEEFLGAEDLDEVLRALHRISSLDASDVAAMRSIFQRWQEPQAISNLLFHPATIPEDIRLTALFRGLKERQVGYFILAAVVGFQSVDPVGLTADDRKHVAEELLGVIRDTNDILAERASVSIERFLSESDAPRVFALWAHRDDTVWHNLRAWLFETFQTRGAGPFAAAASQSGLPAEVQRRLVEDFTEFVNHPRDFSNWVSPLLGYIPNLRDVTQTT